MNTYNFTVPGKFTTLNELIDMSKRHWAEYAKVKQTTTNAVAWAAKEAGIPQLERVELHLTWYWPDRRTDQDNIAAGIKFVLDGLVAAGVLANDGWREVAGFSHSFEVDKENPRVEVKLIETEEGAA